MKTNKKILMALDFTENPQLLIDEALSIIDGESSSIYIVHILEHMPHMSFYSHSYQIWEEFRDKAVKETLGKMEVYIKEFFGKFKEVEAIVEVGDKAEKIVELSKQLNVDMIILGHHIKGTFHSLLHKSISENVIKEAKKTILTIYIPD